MDETDVYLLVLDAEKGITAQDVSICSLAVRKGKGVVVLVNKWDLVENKATNTARDYEKQLKKSWLLYRFPGNIYLCKRKGPHIQGN